MKRRPHILAIAGGSCSGKSELADHLVRSLSRLSPVVLRLDAFYLDLGHLPEQQRSEVNFDEPGALDWPLLISQVALLASGSDGREPDYDFKTHCRIGPGRNLKPKGLVVLEGLFALAEPLLDFLDYKVFVELGWRECLRRRIERDTTLRGRSEDSVRRQFEDTVRPMFRRHVLPTREKADLVLRGDAPPDDLLVMVQRLIHAGECGDVFAGKDVEFDSSLSRGFNPNPSKR